MLFHDRVNGLLSESDKREVRAAVYLYLHAEESWKPALAMLDRFEYRDRIVLFMLAAWKHLAKSRADETRSK
jgi:hypothetical protein